MNTLLETALHRDELEICVLPAKDKYPFGDTGEEWKKYETERPAKEELTAWFSSGEYDQIFQAWGKISGGLVCLDIDKKSTFLYEELLNLLPTPLKEKLNLRENTQTSGIHILYRSLQDTPTRYPVKYYDGLLNSNGTFHELPLIEIKGNGSGYIAAGSAGSAPGKEYTLASGSYDAIPVLTIEEENQLLSAIKSLDVRPRQWRGVLKAYSAGELEDTPFNQALLKKALKMLPSESTNQPTPPAPVRTISAPSTVKPILQQTDCRECLDDEDRADYATLKTNEERLESLRALMPDYLNNLGLDLNAANLQCPHPNHADNTPSAWLSEDQECIFCSCKDADKHAGKEPTKSGIYAFDIFDIVGYSYGLTNFQDKVKKLEDLFGLTPDIKESADNYDDDMPLVYDSVEDYQQAIGIASTTQQGPLVASSDQVATNIEYWHSCVGETDEWAKRGISEELIEKYKLGYDPVNNRLIIPTSDHCYNARNLNPNAKNKYEKSPGTFTFLNQNLLLERQQPLFVTEGEIDALSIELAGGLAIALGGIKGVGNFVKLIATAPKSDQPIIIALDNDPDGQAATRDFATKLREIECPCITYSGIYGDYKDANERWSADPNGLRLTIALGNNPEELKKHLAKEYQKAHSVVAYKETLLRNLEDPAAHKQLPTGIQAVDEVLHGGLINGLTTLGAQSSLGKSSLAWQIGENVAGSGTNVLYFSLEMDQEQFIHKSITRRAYLAGVLRQGPEELPLDSIAIYSWAKNKTFHSEEEEIILRQLIDEYMDGPARHTFVVEADGQMTVTDIRNRIDEHCQITGTAPLVILDYTQMLGSPNDKWDTKKGIDFTCSELRRITRDYKLPILGISSLNRASYTEKISFASFKESGALEYSADQLWGLQPAGIGVVNVSNVGGKKLQRAIEQATNARKAAGGLVPLEFVVLKNRCGLTCSARISFNAKAQYFCQYPDPVQWLKAVWSFVPTSVYAGDNTIRDYLFAVLGELPSEDFIAELNRLRFDDGSNEGYFGNDNAITQGNNYSQHPSLPTSQFGRDVEVTPGYGIFAD